jgi:hypothetical protein
MSDTRLITEREVGSATLRFVWHGGAYIDVGYAPASEDEWAASEVINVWDYTDDKPRIDRTIAAFDAKVDDWIESYPREQLERDMENW